LGLITRDITVTFGVGMGGRQQRDIRMTGVCAALGLHAICLLLFVMAAPKPLLNSDMGQDFNVELWPDVPVVPELQQPKRPSVRQTPLKSVAATLPKISAPVRLHRPPARAEGRPAAPDAGFGRWAVAPVGSGGLSEGLKHPRRCFGLDTPPEGRPKDCPEWAINGTAPPAADPDRDHWRREIRAIEHRQWQRDTAFCHNPNGPSLTALESHRGDKTTFRTSCTGDQDARDEVDFKKGQTVDTKNRPDYGS
jgi:hypothetical protein